MTTAQDIDSHFAWVAQHGGPVVAWQDPRDIYRHGLVGEGLTGWFASDHSEPSKALSIRKHVDVAAGTRMLELRPANHAAPGAQPRVHWDSSLKVGEGRYVRASGSAADFPTALASVEAHAEEGRQLGGLTWWRESEDRWISWLGAFDLAATKLTGAGNEAYWHFEVRGNAPTLEEAALLAALGRLDAVGAAGGQAT
ncbi:hypothetical protein [Variovorax saccharolyticus]|uniref:hypothetical protein n=1 Tax=Variovorax saccharolyticus TaxID=3053516 RepID=UPI002578C232|nr:hypothetical protein [Variovorax sp. J31P216]MDM0029108.1 hypothetical protein [Variovorax sp. J31P216]